MRLRALILSASLALAGAAFSQATSDVSTKVSLSKEIKEAVLKDVNKIMTENAFVPGADFTKWNDFIKGEQENVDKSTSARDFVLTINQALRKFGLSHIVLQSPEAAQARVLRKAVGIGIQIEIEPGGIRVANVFPGSPAEEAGLRPGDLIVEHNGKKPETQSDMAGEEGQEAKLKVQRDGKEIKINVVRKQYSNVRPESLTWTSKDTAQIRIWTFDLSYDRKNVDKLFKEAAGAKNLILDLRSNGGGAVVNMMHLLSLMMPPETPIGTFVGRSVVDRYIKEKGGKAEELDKIAKWYDRPLKTSKPAEIEPYKGNIVVLLNGGSGSASEISAAALQEMRGAGVIGSKSAGAVLVSIMRPIANGYLLQYPITDYVTPNGVRLEGRGVIPVVEANPNPKFGEKDEAIVKAELYLQHKARGDGRTKPQ